MRAPKRPSVFLQRNTKFQNCTQTVLRFSSGKCKILKTVPKRPSVFSQQNTKFWKLHPNSHSFFYNEMQNSESCTQTAIHDSLKEIRNVTIYHQFSFVSQKQKKIKNMILRYLGLFFYNEKQNQKHYWTLNYTLFTKRVIKI